jgi:hypothetical protein
MGSKFRWLAVTVWLALEAQTARECFVISVVDEATGRGVPLVELRTTAKQRYYSDSNGLIALTEPGLMNREVFFEVKSDGYEYPKDGFEYRGKALKITANGSAVLKVRRTQIAERLYRVTGAGIYQDTVMAGRTAPIKQPLLNAQVTGQDTVMATVYRGKLYWFWGDTNRPSYPLGNFAATGATSELPGKGGLDPSAGVDLHYFTRGDGFVQPVADIPGDGPKWLFGLMTIPDHTGRERLLARYDRIKNLREVYETGLSVFDDGDRVFRKLAEFPKGSPIVPDGRPLRVKVRGTDYYYFSALDAMPWLRVKADWDAVQRQENYEVFGCTRAGCAWKQDAAGRPDPSLSQMRDLETGKPIRTRLGTVFWNEFRKCWVAILQQAPGGVYYAEADTVTGPWAYARKVLQHDRYNFYWPGQHPYFDQEGGRVIYFEGTYTASFSSAPVETPLYDYNQIMYRLRLDDERLNLPAPVYRMKSGDYRMRAGVTDWRDVDAIAWFALRGAQDGKRWESPYTMPVLDPDAHSW